MARSRLSRQVLVSVADVESLGTPVEGELGYDDTENVAKFYNGSAWRSMDASAISGNMPVGGVCAWGTTTAPTGYLICDGSAVSRTTYAALYAVIGTTFGAGNGSTTFNLPDIKGRAIYGKGAHTNVDAMGENDGATDANRSPYHKHNSNFNTGAASAGGAAGGGNNLGTLTSHTHAVSGDTSSVTVPYITMNWIIKT